MIPEQNVTSLDSTIAGAGTTTARQGLSCRFAAALARAGRVRAWLSRGDRYRLLAAALLAFLGGAATILVLILLARLIQTVQAQAPADMWGNVWRGPVGWYLGLIAVIFLAGEALGFVKKYLIQRVSTRLHQELTLGLADRLHHADLEILTREPAGARLARLARAAEGIVCLLGAVFVELLPAVCTLLCALLYAVLAQPWIGLVLAGVVPVVLGIDARQRLRDKGIRRELCQEQDRLDGVLTEQFGGIEAIRAANTQDGEVQKVASLVQHRCEKQVGLLWRTTLAQSFKVLLGWLFQFAVLAVAVVLCGNGKMSIAEIAVFGNLFFSVYVPLWQIQYALEKVLESAARLDDLRAGLAEPSDRSFEADGRTPAAIRPNQDVPLVQARQVVVQYRHGAEQASRALDGLCVTIGWG
ncbi:MAG TPA: ABC transporter transmembrane domain-containing protein, partial [Gemmataceae bacterium]|nr:ABC transporter transmembrane domain-containing protein [Gemmataceae bacterium]